MANTAITDLTSERILLNPTMSGVRVVNGTLATDLPPGTFVIYDPSNNNWKAADSATAGDGLANLGCVGYRKRVRQSTNALVTITDNWDVSEPEDKMTPIILSGVVVGKIVDQSATVGAGTPLTISSTAGALTKLALDGSNGDLRALDQAALAADVASGDTVAVIGLGAFKGYIWGNVN